MTHASRFWVAIACAAMGATATGGVANPAIASSVQSAAPPWPTLAVAKLKQKQAQPTLAQRPVEPPSSDPASPELPLPFEESPVDLPPEIIEDSPVLQRWLDDIPNVQQDIRNDPAFRTRLRAGYADVDGQEGFFIGLEDAFLGRTGLTLSAEYQGTFENDRELYGSDLRYYVLPLGSVVNLAPVVGYRRLNLSDDEFEGLHAGLRAVLALSRTGAADLSLTQSWVAVGTDDEVGLTTLSVGYAVSDRLRLTTDIQAQNSTQSKDTRVGIGLEWML